MSKLLEYRQPSGDTVVTIKGANKEDLVLNVLKYRKERDIKSQDYNVVFNDVTRQLKSRRPVVGKPARIPNMRDDVAPIEREKTRVSVADMFKGAIAILDITKGNWCGQSELERRANICYNCTKATTASGCMGCGAGKMITRKVLDFQREIGVAFEEPNKTRAGMKKSERLGQLFCKVCGCSLLTMCASLMRNFRESEGKNQSRPDHCWVKKGSKNYIDDPK